VNSLITELHSNRLCNGVTYAMRPPAGPGGQCQPKSTIAISSLNPPEGRRTACTRALTASLIRSRHRDGADSRRVLDQPVACKEQPAPAQGASLKLHRLPRAEGNLTFLNFSATGEMPFPRLGRFARFAPAPGGGPRPVGRAGVAPATQPPLGAATLRIIEGDSA
jgi:hypothetical protein